MVSPYQAGLVNALAEIRRLDERIEQSVARLRANRVEPPGQVLRAEGQRLRQDMQRTSTQIAQEFIESQLDIRV